MKSDRYYSSTEIAQRVVSYVPEGAPRRFIDPTVGSGALLAAARERFVDGSFFGVDIDKRAMCRLKRIHPQWAIGVGDALHSRSIAASRVWTMARSSGPVYGLMNPPFSFRGGAGLKVVIDGNARTVSPACAFVVQTVKQLPNLSGLVAILPEGAWVNVRDQAVWAWLGARFNAQVVEKLGPRSFAGAVANTFIVKLDRISKPVEPVHLPRPIIRLAARCCCVEVVRGRVPVARSVSVSPDTRPFLHSTDLRQPTGDITRRALGRLATPGRLIVFPRVGPTPEGRIVAPAAENLVLSDCVMGVRPVNPTVFGELYRFLQERAGDMAALYRGTGARHLTVKVLLDFFISEGWNASHRPASSRPAACTCGASTRGTDSTGGERSYEFSTSMISG
jgi:hypothetical protein